MTVPHPNVGPAPTSWAPRQHYQTKGHLQRAAPALVQAHRGANQDQSSHMRRGDSIGFFYGGDAPEWGHRVLGMPLSIISFSFLFFFFFGSSSYVRGNVVLRNGTPFSRLAQQIRWIVNVCNTMIVNSYMTHCPLSWDGRKRISEGMMLHPMNIGWCLKWISGWMSDIHLKVVQPYHLSSQCQRGLLPGVKFWRRQGSDSATNSSSSPVASYHLNK